MKTMLKRAALMTSFGLLITTAAGSYGGWDPVSDIKKAAKAVVRHVPAIVAPGTTVVADVVKGTPVDKAVKKPIVAATETAKIVAETAASQTTQAKAVVAKKVVAPVLGDKAGKAMIDVDTLTSHEHDVASLVAAVNETVKTGELAHLNPVYMKAAAEIRRVRDQYWGSAHPIPNDVTAALPKELKPYANKARYVLMSDVGSINIPAFATVDRDGIVMIDLIFVKVTAPHDGEVENAYFWTHELYHVKQYTDMGLSGFVETFLGDEIGPHGANHDGVNVVEREADVFACRHYPVGNNIAYLKSCLELGQIAAAPL